jgi:hypothetical protein
MGREIEGMEVKQCREREVIGRVIERRPQEGGNRKRDRKEVIRQGEWEGK